MPVELPDATVLAMGPQNLGPKLEPDVRRGQSEHLPIGRTEFGVSAKVKTPIKEDGRDVGYEVRREKQRKSGVVAEVTTEVFDTHDSPIRRMTTKFDAEGVFAEFTLENHAGRPIKVVTRNVYGNNEVSYSVQTDFDADHEPHRSESINAKGIREWVSQNKTEIFGGKSRTTSSSYERYDDTGKRILDSTERKARYDAKGREVISEIRKVDYKTGLVETSETNTTYDGDTRTETTERSRQNSAGRHFEDTLIVEVYKGGLLINDRYVTTEFDDRGAPKTAQKPRETDYSYDRLKRRRREDTSVGGNLTITTSYDYFGLSKTPNKRVDRDWVEGTETEYEIKKDPNEYASRTDYFQGQGPIEWHRIGEPRPVAEK